MESFIVCRPSWTWRPWGRVSYSIWHGSSTDPPWSPQGTSRWAHRPSPLGEPSLEMQPNDYAKRSMLTFLRWTKNPLWREGLNYLERLINMRRNKYPPKSGYPLKMRVSAILQSSTVKERGDYKTALLWKQDPNLPNNRAIAVSRLLSAEKKL